MAATPAGARLTVEFQRTQARISAVSMRRLLELAPLLAAHTTAGDEAFIAAATDITLGGRQLSREAAIEYVAAFRLAEGIPGDARLPAAFTAPLDAITVSMRVTGPIAYGRGLGAGMGELEALSNALVQASGSVARHVQNGGRDAIDGAVQDDPAALGWSRVTSASPCAFCALLASRGPVYKSRQTANFRAHDHCHCTPEPVYDEAAAWTDQARGFRDLYATAASGEKDKLNAFRRALAAQRRSA